MRYQNDINTEHNMKSICRAAVAHWTKRLTPNGYTRVQNWKRANILLLQSELFLQEGERGFRGTQWLADV